MTQQPPQPEEQPRRRMPLSTPPAKPTNWWKSVPGQLAILVMVIALIVIILGLTGVIQIGDSPGAG